MKQLAQFLVKYMDDLLLVIGLIFINLATFRLGTTLGLYCVGLTLVAAGVFFARFPLRR